MRVEFDYRPTPKGCAVWMMIGRSTLTKKFVDTPKASAMLKAANWVESQRLSAIRRRRGCLSDLEFEIPEALQITTENRARLSPED